MGIFWHVAIFIAVVWLFSLCIPNVFHVDEWLINLAIVSPHNYTSVKQEVLQSVLRNLNMMKMLKKNMI